MIASCFVGYQPEAVGLVTEPNSGVAASMMSTDATDSVGLVRSWEAILPVALGEDAGSDIKFVIPAASHPAFYLKPEQLDELLNNPDVTEATRQEFLGNLDVWVALKTDRTQEVVSSKDRGVHGRVLGVEGALRLAEIREEVLTQQGIQVEKKVWFIPHAMVFALNDGGVLQAMDAETGKVRWTRRLRRGRAPIQGYAVSDHTIAVINGSRLELYDAMTGTLLKDHSVELLPWGPPAIAGEQILVTGANGRIELLIPFGEKSYRSAEGGFSGRMQMPLTELNRSYVWGVQGAVYISERGKPARPLFRIPTNETQSIPPVGVGNLMILATAGGEVKCFTQTSGLSVWSNFIGQNVVQQPVILELPPAAGAQPETEAADESPADNAFGDPATDDTGSDDPFGAPAEPAADSDDPFGGSDTAEAGQEDDPFGGAAAPPANDDPFAGGDPFSGDGDPFASDSSPFSGGFDSAEGEATEGTTIRRSRTVDMATALPTESVVRALMVTESGDLLAVDVRTGDIVSSFRSGNIKQVLTVTSKFIYAMTMDNQLVALDAETGVAIGAMPMSADWHGVVNTISDRVYLQNDNGQVLCLRPRASMVPRFQIPYSLEKKEISLESEQAAETAPTTEEDDFFGSGDGDPFGSGVDDDPFK